MALGDDSDADMLGDLESIDRAHNNLLAEQEEAIELVE